MGSSMMSKPGDLSQRGRMMAAAGGEAMPDGRFPVRNRKELESAIELAGRANGGEATKRAIRRFIMARAKQMGCQNMIPADWKADGSLATQ